MATYQKKPLRVQAVQYDGRIDPPGVFRDEDRAAYVVTIHGQRAYLVPGDYVITEPDGVHHYPCKQDIFEKSYDLVKEGV